MPIESTATAGPLDDVDERRLKAVMKATLREMRRRMTPATT